jgi:hypothetical protein
MIVDLEPRLQAWQVEQPVSIQLVPATDLKVVAHLAVALHQITPQVADATILHLAAAGAQAAAVAAVLEALAGFMGSAESDDW